MMTLKEKIYSELLIKEVSDRRNTGKPFDHICHNAYEAAEKAEAFYLHREFHNEKNKLGAV